MKNGVMEIKSRAKNGKPPVASGRSSKFRKISFDELIFIPAQLTKNPVDYFRAEVSSKTVIGKTSKHPVELKIPIMIGGMSFGALSKSAKVALARASSLAGTCANTGEGGMLSEERAEANILVAQYSTGRFGVDDDYLKKADMIEVKIGQGAKPGQGGLLQAEKVTDEIAKVRKVPKGEDVHSPPYHPDIKDIAELKKRIQQIREKTNGKPIILKLGAGHVEEDVKLAVEANPDVIAIDGHCGGTGAAPEIMLNDFGTPTLPALVRARKTMDELRAKQELIIGGGLTTGADMAKALALGADAVFVGFPMMVAMGCVYCKQCYVGRCPKGVATQDPEFEKNIAENADELAANYLMSCTEEIKMVAAATGKADIHELDRRDLRSISLFVEKITGIPLV